MNQLETEDTILARGVQAPSREGAADEIYSQAMAAIDVAQAGLQSLDDTSRRPSLGVKLSVVIPVYNERDTIAAVVQRVLDEAPHADIVIVDDYSTDGTREVLLELAELPGVRILMHGYNKGKGAAVQTAFEYVRGDVILIQDADLEYNPTDYAKLVQPIADGMADVVYGSRFMQNPEQDPSWWHRFGNRLLTRISNFTTGLRLTDMETCYKVFRRGVLRGMVLREQRFGFEPEFTAKLARRRCRIAEVPIGYQARGLAEGKKIGIRDGFRALYCIVRYAFWD